MSLFATSAGYFSPSGHRESASCINFLKPGAVKSRVNHTIARVRSNFPLIAFIVLNATHIMKAWTESFKMRSKVCIDDPSKVDYSSWISIQMRCAKIFRDIICHRVVSSTYRYLKIQRDYKWYVTTIKIEIILPEFYCLRKSLSKRERKIHVIFYKRDLKKIEEIEIFKRQLINIYSIK